MDDQATTNAFWDDLYPYDTAAIHATRTGLGLN